MTDKKMARSEDLTGARFGHLTVLEKTDKTQDRYCVWRCKCDCGREIEVNTKRLKNGIVTNCGCIPKTTARRGNIAEDLTGRTFGYLTVLHRTENRGDRTCWLCQCDCGNEAEVTEGSLVQGKSLSCGCLKRENQKEIAGKLQRVDGTCIEILEKRKYRRDNTSGFRGVFKKKTGHIGWELGLKGKDIIWVHTKPLQRQWMSDFRRSRRFMEDCKL